MHSYSPLISVIIAVHNGAIFLEGAIKSIIDQSYKNFELIIIDGGSTDGTIEIIKRYKNYIKHTVSENDKGIYAAWNKGLKFASGDWITFIGCDDVLYSHAFSSYVNHINLYFNIENIDFVSSKIEFTDEKMNIIKVIGQPWEWNLFKRKMITGHVGTFHSKNFFLKYGIFDESYKISGDYELLLRPKNSLKTLYLPVVTVRMRDGGVSSRPSYKSISERIRARVTHNIVPPKIGLILSIYYRMKTFILGID